jgi:GrpB-like predicted nucleotidyltransferase (UPF0157 family)
MADMAVQIVGYDPHWPDLFAEQRNCLQEILDPWLAGPIEHVGSTAVPRLAAKPIVDILAPVVSLVRARSAVEHLAVAGWLHWPEDPNRSWRLWFLRPRVDARTHHLYLIERGDPHIVELTRFRDLLRSDAQVRREYELLKRKLARTHRDDRDAYARAKAAFLRTVLRNNGIGPSPRH